MAFVLAQTIQGAEHGRIIMTLLALGLGTILGIIACICANIKSSCKVGIVLGGTSIVSGLLVIWSFFDGHSYSLVRVWGSISRHPDALIITIPAGLGALAIAISVWRKK